MDSHLIDAVRAIRASGYGFGDIRAAWRLTGGGVIPSSYAENAQRAGVKSVLLRQAVKGSEPVVAEVVGCSNYHVYAVTGGEVHRISLRTGRSKTGGFILSREDCDKIRCRVTRPELSTLEKLILGLLKNGQYRIAELSTLLGVPRTTVLSAARSLIARGSIRRTAEKYYARCGDDEGQWIRA